MFKTCFKCALNRLSYQSGLVSTSTLSNLLISRHWVKLWTNASLCFVTNQSYLPRIFCPTTLMAVPYQESSVVQ